MQKLKIPVPIDRDTVFSSNIITIVEFIQDALRDSQGSVCQGYRNEQIIIIMKQAAIFYFHRNLCGCVYEYVWFIIILY